MRSLHADGRSRRVIWFLLIPVAVLAAWSAWFIQARVPRYELSDRAVVDTTSRIIAEFSSANQIRSGQAARFQTNSGNVTAHVTHVAALPNGRAHVELAIDSNSSQPSPGTSGTVEVVIESVSPAALLLRAAGERGQGR